MEGYGFHYHLSGMVFLNLFLLIYLHTRRNTDMRCYKSSDNPPSLIMFQMKSQHVLTQLKLEIIMSANILCSTTINWMSSIIIR